jgi:KUP system potassium uptake protein
VDLAPRRYGGLGPHARGADPDRRIPGADQGCENSARAGHRGVGERLTIDEVAPNFWRGEAHFGFMERPHIPELLAASKSLGCTIELADVTYYVGHETVIGRDDGMGMPGWQERFFAVMERNAVHVSDFFSLPNDQVVEIGRQVAI